MELAQIDESTGTQGAGRTSGKDRGSTSLGPVLFFMRMLGKTVGLAQKAGAKLGEDVVDAGRRVRRLPENISRKRTSAAKIPQQKPQAEPASDLEKFQHAVSELHAKIGERLCYLAQVDASLLPEDRELEDLVAAVLDWEDEIRIATAQSMAGAGSVADEPEAAATVRQDMAAADQMESPGAPPGVAEGDEALPAEADAAAEPVSPAASATVQPVEAEVDVAEVSQGFPEHRLEQESGESEKAAFPLAESKGKGEEKKKEKVPPAKVKKRQDVPKPEAASEEEAFFS